MAIEQSVGKSGHNDKIDVKIVQAALNLIDSAAFQLPVKLAVDGEMGANTIAAIENFQKKIIRFLRPDGRVDPGGRTLRALKQHLTKGLSTEALLAIMAFGSAKTIQRFLPLFDSALSKYEIDRPLRAAHFLAQVGHESLSLTYTEEIASGAAYEGRSDLGNTEPGDGPRFKGRGLIQLTGRLNYARYGDYAGIDFLKKGNETLIGEQPEYALDVSLWYWSSRHLNDYADRDELRTITRGINNGYNGLEDRQKYLNRAKFFLLPQ